MFAVCCFVMHSSLKDERMRNTSQLQTTRTWGGAVWHLLHEFECSESNSLCAHQCIEKQIWRSGNHVHCCHAPWHAENKCVLASYWEMVAIHDHFIWVHFWLPVLVPSCAFLAFCKIGGKVSNNGRLFTQTHLQSPNQICKSLTNSSNHDLKRPHGFELLIRIPIDSSSCWNPMRTASLNLNWMHQVTPSIGIASSDPNHSVSFASTIATVPSFVWQKQEKESASKSKI